MANRIPGAKLCGDYWKCLCPAHDDQRESLSFKDGEKAVLLKCHAGCELNVICERLGLSSRDLYFDAMPHTNGHASRIVKTYDYCDEQGGLLYQVVRSDPKDFRQRRPNGHGGWLWNLKDRRRVVYRLPELIGRSSVFIVEGEKDADRLWDLGLPSTTNAGGAGKWSDELTAQLKDAGIHSVVVLPDNDDPGRQHAQSVARSCVTSKLAVKIVALPNLPLKGDLSNFLDSGGTLEQLNDLVANSAQWRADVPTAIPAPLRLTDVSNGERFAEQHRENIRYCFALKQWLIWDGQRWKPDTEGRAMSLAKRTARSLYGEAERESDENRRKALAKWAVESETERRLKSLLSLAQSEPGIAIEAERLDGDPFLLNVMNGTLDLRTGELRPARREDFITKLARVECHGEAGCPYFERLLNRLFDTVPAIREYLQRIFGYALTGLTTEQCFFIFHGTGANGKSTVLRTILDLLGDYATTTRPETFLTKRGEGIPNDVAALAGARFVVALESEQGKRLAEGLVKGMTGGDKLSARFLNKEFFSFTPQLKLFIGTNHKPTIKGTDHGTWRRVRCIPFAVVIPDAEQDKTLLERLRMESPGILNWLIQGCLGSETDSACPQRCKRQQRGIGQNRISWAHF